MALERLKNKVKHAFTSVSVITYALVVIFGAGSWIAVNGLWVELPIIVQEIPEGWSLPSYLTFIIQLANIAPLAFTLGNIFYPRVVREVPVIYISVLIGITSCALLAFFWKETSYIAGAERSIALLILCFFVSMVDCSSSVTFLPYMAIFREVYMSPYFGGQGLSGLLPSLVALAQGVGGGSHTPCVSPTQPPVNTTYGTSANDTAAGSWGPGPKFSAEVFFWFLSGMMVACGLAFLGLNYLPVAKRQHVARNNKGADHEAQLVEQAIELVSEEERQGSNNSPNDDDHVVVEQLAEQAIELVSEEERQGSNNSPNDHGHVVVENLCSGTVVLLLIITDLISGLSNGVIPAIQSYACIPYSYYIYHLTLTLSNIVNPITCFVFPFIHTTSTMVIAVLSFVYFGMCTYIFIIASQSPMVLLRCEDSGAALIVSRSFYE